MTTTSDTERTRFVTVHEFDSNDEGNWPPTGAAAFLAWIADKLQAIPPEHRDSATIEIRSRRDWEDSVAELTIGYTRQETPAEAAEREASVRRSKEVKEASERRTLAALKAKYEA